MTAAQVRLDSWRVWMMVAFAGIVLLFICVLVLFAKQQNANARERDRTQAAKTEALAQAKIANSNQVGACVAAYRSAPNVLRILDVLDVLAGNSLMANRDALKREPDSPLTPIRRASLKRLGPAPHTIQVFRDATIKDQRTLAECKALATKLHVDIEPFLKPKPGGTK